MAAPTISEIRTAVVDALTGLTGWVESRSHYDLIAPDPDQMLHRSFAVAVPETVVTDPRRRNHVRGTEPGMLVETRILTRWVHRLRADNQRADLQTAYTEELTALQAVASATVSGIGPITPARISRRAVGDGTWHTTEVEWVCGHVYAAHDPTP